MKKKYVVELAEQEREYLHKLISSGSAPARKLNRARILLTKPPRRQTRRGTGAQRPTDRPDALERPPPPHSPKGTRERF
jgi:hypothetical protein